MSSLGKDNKYTEMQRRSYEQEASHWSAQNRDPVVGFFDQHNSWQDYDDYLFRDIRGDLRNQVVLDFGCGPGRNLVKYSTWFNRIDGVDISSKNIENARIWLEKNSCPVGNLYHNNGVDLSEIQDNVYDIVMSTICFQHICVYDIRRAYLKEFHRVLKSGGTLTMQMGYGGRDSGVVGYYDNYLDAAGTNSFMDVSVLDESDLRHDLEAEGFTDFRCYIRPVGPGDTHQNWIFFSAKKG